MIQILELFGGIGSPRKALINLGLPVKSIDYVEIDEKAVKSYNAIFNNELQYKTQTVVGWNLRPDILIHGSPCQDFSIAGHQKGAEMGSETRSSLMWETINIIKQMGTWRPKIVIWENVKNVLSKHMVHNFNRYLSEMKKLGYTNSFQCLNAMEFGLPHNRDRVFTISCLDGTCFNFDELERTSMRSISEFIEKVVSEEYLVTQNSLLSMIGSKGIKRIDIIDKYCFTIRTRQDQAPNAGVVSLGNDRYRFLTELECWRLQGYSDEDFYNAAKVNTKRALYKQAGNSIPIPIFESIFKKIA